MSLLPRHSTIWFLVFGALLMGGCAGSGGLVDAGAERAAIVVEKSPNDNRDYRYLVLDNALRVLLVSDPESDRAAASLTVLRGYYHEPDDYPGLAHFLEHMLFIGTRKYPEVDGYQQFLSAHGGQSNAYTSAEHTNYFFEVQPEHFEEAMDRFSQFFISPLLDAEYVEREKNAVNSEYQLQIKDDGWRGNAVAKTAMDPAYEGSRFYIGSLDTLDEGVDKALAEFFRTQYSADQMVLVALGTESLDALESWVRPMFSAIENRQIGPAADPQPAFAAGDLPATLRYQTLNQNYQMSFNFPLPELDAHYRSKPAQYLSNLLGHEGEGSLHQLLKARGWIESLGAGVGRLDATNALLSVNIDLTPAGREATAEITDLLFGYIGILQNSPPEAWRYQEQASAAELSFRFQEPSSPTGFVYRTAPNLALYPPEDVLVADYLMEGFDPELIRHYLAFLTPENLLLELAGPDLSTDSVEPWFNVPYNLERRIADTPKPRTDGMHLPEPNPFLPEDVTLTTAATAPPSLTVDRAGSRIWLAPDVEFRVPRAHQTFTLGIEGGLTTPRDVVLANIYQQLVNDALNHYAYPALLAGLSYQVGVSPAGFRVSVSGYSDKQPELLDRVLEEFVGHRIDASRFELYRQELIREWENFRHERPYTQTYAALSNLVLSGSFAPATLAEAASTVTPADLSSWREERLGAFSIVGLAHGNLEPSSLEDVDRLLDDHLPLADFELVKPDVAVVDEALLYELAVDHDDASMVLYVQDPEASFESRALSALTAHILQQAYFSSLRTDQQLGYVVTMTNRTIRDRGAIVFIIQSPVASPAMLEQATLSFMNAELPAVREMNEPEFEQFKAGLISRLTERPKNLRERNARYLADLEAEVTTFDSQQRIADIVAGLTLEDVSGFLESTIARLENARLLIFNRGHFTNPADAPHNGRRLTGPLATHP